MTFIADKKSRFVPDSESKPDPGSIYKTGGAYDQFGPNTRAFNPLDGIKKPLSFNPITPAANQPGAALPFVGQMAGNLAMDATGPIGMAAGGIGGAELGEAARQGIGRVLGVQDGADSGKQFQAAGDAAAIGEAIPLGLMGLQPLLKHTGTSVMNNIIGVTKGKAKNLMETQGLDLGEEALKRNLTGFTKGSLQKKADAIAYDASAKIKQILDAHAGEQISTEDMFNSLEDLKQKSGQGDSSVQNSIQSVIDDLKDGMGTNKPVYGEKSTQFVIPKGSDSTLTKPEIVGGQRFGTEQVDNPSYNADFGQREAESGERPTLLRSGEKSVIPQTTVKGNPDDIYGRPTTEVGIVGDTGFDVPIEEGQAQKVALGHQMKNFNPFTAQPGKQEAKILARRGIKNAIEQVAPEIKQPNRDFGFAADVSDLLSGQIAKDNITPLPGQIALGKHNWIIERLKDISGFAPLSYPAKASYTLGTMKNKASSLTNALLAQALKNQGETNEH